MYLWAMNFQSYRLVFGLAPFAKKVIGFSGVDLLLRVLWRLGSSKRDEIWFAATKLSKYYGTVIKSSETQTSFANWFKEKANIVALRYYFKKLFRVKNIIIVLGSVCSHGISSFMVLVRVMSEILIQNRSQSQNVPLRNWMFFVWF